MTSLSGIAADDGNFCTGLEVGLPLEVAVGLALGVGDCPAGLTDEKEMLGEAVVLSGSPLPEIWNPTPTATPTSTRVPAMIETNLPRDPPDPSPPGPGGYPPGPPWPPPAP
jgi:hypothetical protein